MVPTGFQKCKALLLQRCPNCCQGPIYERGMNMHARCPVCNILYEREPGYFLGALYISYGMASILLMLALWVSHLLLPTVDLGWLVLVCAVFFIPFVPAVTRYSRVIWMFFDRWAWPTRPGEMDHHPPA